MTSPVNTEVKWARSTMPGAPVLTRAAGSLISLLDALCVDGWGLQTATSVVVSGGFATATFATDHAAAPHAVVLVAGVTGTLAGLNGEQKVTSVLANKIKWATAEADGTAAGTITVKMAAAGWTKPFSGTNLAVYKSARSDANGQFLRVADTTAGYARATGYETMTAVSTGTGLFPSAAQVNGGYYWGKTSMTSGTDPVPWAFASDGRMLYLFTLTESSPSTPDYGVPFGMLFGDMVPVAASGDPFATLIFGVLTATDVTGYAVDYALNNTSPNTLHATPRPSSGIGTSTRGLMMPLAGEATGAPNFPNPISGAISASEVYYQDNNTLFRRARLPGILRSTGSYAENLAIPKFGVLGGAGPQRAYLHVPASTYGGATTNFRAVLVDLTGPWR